MSADIRTQTAIVSNVGSTSAIATLADAFTSRGGGVTFEYEKKESVRAYNIVLRRVSVSANVTIEDGTRESFRVQNVFIAIDLENGAYYVPSTFRKTGQPRTKPFWTAADAVAEIVRASNARELPALTLKSARVWVASIRGVDPAMTTREYMSARYGGGVPLWTAAADAPRHSHRIASESIVERESIKPR